MERFADEDRAAVERWCAERRADVAAYLRREGIAHGAIDGQPAWFVAPYASIWSVGALGRPGWRARWVICGDLPTDCVDADGLASPREAMRAFGERWLDVAACMARGEPHASLRIGTGTTQLLFGRKSETVSYQNQFELLKSAMQYQE